jgi:3-oxoadipate enol-lactonase
MRQTRQTGAPVAIAYDIEGSGPLVVFLHGIGGNRSNWEEQVAFFATRFCAVAWDARGYGASDDPPQTLKFSDYADDLVRVLDHLGAERAHLVGLSMGGMILQDFYGRYADRVATLVLVDTSVGFGSVSEEVRRDFLAHRLDPLERGLQPADIAPGVVEVLVAKSATATARQRMRASIQALRVEPYKQALRAIITTDFRVVLPHIDVPTLVIVGDEDIVTPPADSEVLTRNIPGAKLVTIPGAGHLTNIEQPEAFNAALEAFLNPYASYASVVSSGRA